MTYIRFLRQLINNDRQSQWLWKSEDGHYYVSSAVVLPYDREHETMVFRADILGHIDNYTDLGMVRELDHGAAINSAGFTIVDDED